MTTYKQNVPEQIWVSPASYLELLNSPVIDTFAVQKPASDNCPHFQADSTGRCWHCFESVIGEDEMEYARRTR